MRGIKDNPPGASRGTATAIDERNVCQSVYDDSTHRQPSQPEKPPFGVPGAVQDAPNRKQRASDVAMSQGTHSKGYHLVTSPVANTSQGQQIRVDFLSVTLSSEVAQLGGTSGVAFDVAAILDEICLPVEGWEQGGGFNGWKHHVELDGLKGTKLAWGGQFGTVFLSLSASALHFYATARGLDVVEFIEHLYGLGCHVSRLDLAYDDFARRVTFAHIMQAKEAGGIVTRLRFRPERSHVPQLLDRETSHGWTLYWGSKKSTYLRIYDKRAERIAKGEACDAPFWVRVEAELHSKAHAVTKELIERGWRGDVLKAILRSIIDFRQPQGANKSRWPMLPWWENFLGGCDAVLRPESPDTDNNRTVEDDYRYALRQAARPFARIAEVYGMEAIQDIIEAGRRRFDNSDKSMIEMSKAKIDSLRGA